MIELTIGRCIVSGLRGYMLEATSSSLAGSSSSEEDPGSLPADPGIEVVANDLGLLVALADAGWGGTTVAGRLLTRQRRGPGFESLRDVPAAAREALRGSGLDSPAFVDLLRATCNVRRFEIDDLAQGADVPSLPDGVRLSLYRPWALVTATRNCPWVFDGRGWDRERGFARPCRGRRLNLEPEGWSGASLVLGGCAQFLRVDAGGRPIPPGVDRVVWQPEVPA